MPDIVYLILVVLGFNVMPAFAPPTWTALVFFSLNTTLRPLEIVLVGALCAGTGRYILARTTRLFRKRISKKSRENLEAAEKVITQNTSRKLFTLGLFILSPLPSAQLFEAAGLIGVKLLPLTIAFFSGRIITYNFYVLGSHKFKDSQLGELVVREFSSAWAITFQLLMIAALVALTRVDWKRFLPPKATPPSNSN